ncbi:MAG: TIGR01906 family membrane protein [Chloroflexi bacterium]|jgi:integral membrane protein (TIGR01906 family)|nr:TIGR01906 family membrane protein [Anaerolineaceae bacterium]NLI45323.1 TIGR01906 family membrane protein [Chloroflexota bacterium]HOE34545.1 TIGR01906 family membrane protein [Anaerolineaceae bacterium]HOT25041.1 TIGR01906 family membrane protein [Anaerolineaceae bacterium]HQH57693.1 TIGR01906 family membrane protein [Anaerolineaceae bacterium]
MKSSLDKALVIILAVILPFILLLGAVRLIMTPQFPKLEYQRPGFPADPYGFSAEERTKWSAYAVNYLVNDADISYLQELRFADGRQLYRVEELSHMEDVKSVVRTALTVWYGLIGAAFALGAWFAVMGSWRTLGKAVRTGAWLSIGLIAFIVVMTAVSFNTLFDRFHRLFFTEGSWLFYQNDTLIRLFPLVFWRDAFLLVGLTVLLAAGLLLWITRGVRRKES